MLDRIIRIIKLDFGVFKEIESDPQATTQAAIIVGITSVLSAIGSALSAEKGGATFLSGVLGGLIGWVVWSYVSQLVGRFLFKSNGTFEEMLRVVGYSNAPLLLGVLRIIPCVGGIGALAGWILALIASVMAIREGLDLTSTQAIIVAVIGALSWAIVAMILGIVLGVGMAF